MYLKTWTTPGMQEILRKGANWMIADDHDFANNANSELLTSPIKEVLQAGKKVYLEYQYQLFKDLEDGEGQTTEAVEKSITHEFKVIGNTGLIFLDTRVHSTFNFEPEFPFLGKQQWLDLNVSFFFSFILHPSSSFFIFLSFLFPLPFLFFSLAPNIYQSINAY